MANSDLLARPSLFFWHCHKSAFERFFGMVGFRQLTSPSNLAGEQTKLAGR